MKCADCHHEEHAAGGCPFDNCAESEISHSTAMSTDYTWVVALESFQRGQVATKKITHIKPRSTGNN